MSLFRKKIVTLTLAACTGGALPALGASESVLHSFTNGQDGGNPTAPLIKVDGEIYGTTKYGGVYHGGVVFKMTLVGAETVLHAFGNPLVENDGSQPGGLVQNSRTVYGTTASGGLNFAGAVFRVKKSGSETTAYSFGANSNSDGVYPVGSMINIRGTMYGATYFGGQGEPGGGTLFSVTRDGSENVLYSFGGAGDGLNPMAGLANEVGILYGTTFGGGANGAGSVYSYNPNTGTEAVIHSFGAGTDGAQPQAGLFDYGGILYGTTFGGGAYGNGTVFQITPTGQESVVYSFGKKGGGDGQGPDGGLISFKGELYGTTYGGGANGLGTVFRITPAGKEVIVYSFQSGSDGQNPEAGLVVIKGNLYGTTLNGGTDNSGTVFKITQ